MRMADHDGVESFGVEREIAVALHRFVPASLEKSALKQDALPIHLEKRHRAGGRSISAQELNLHASRRVGVSDGKWKVGDFGRSQLPDNQEKTISAVSRPPANTFPTLPQNWSSPPSTSDRLLPCRARAANLSAS